ncbi:Protein CBG03097 [Caenorhabditis briggsae]|uniref:Protein CBG03097 n=1 Tax=Caenorhabditis briggsae TaxID=6238 RepID=A8WST1_CAEBR|nr:Protein CBG03097 [Caenorhabditis briggsae]CAP23540.2 Protein CBG03097 [Caenorhabditis briggsae]
MLRKTSTKGMCTDGKIFSFGLKSETKMKIFSVSFLLFRLQVSYCMPARGDATDDDTETTTASPISNYMDRQCGENLSNLWLDIVCVVDISKGMTNQGLTKVAANIASVFSMGTRIGTQAGEPRTTRVALATYNQNAKINAGLDVYQSLDDLYDDIFTVLHAVSSTDESYLARGIAAAGDLLHIAKQNDNDGALLEDLALVGSPNFNFANTDSNPVGEIQGALLQANCFCPNGWTQYRTSYAYVNSYRFGVCIAPTLSSAVWRAAKLSCRNQWKNVYLLNEPHPKHDSIQNTLPIPHRTLLFKWAWYWEQPDGQPLKQLHHWTNGNPWYPKSDSSLTVFQFPINQNFESGMVNCFNPDGWTQYRSSYSYVDSSRFGVCMAATVIEANWRAAQFSCRSQYSNAYLINEYDLNKHKYILDFLQNITEFKKPYTYHLGLSYSKGTYWNPGYPKSDSTLTGVTNFENQGEESSGWQNVNVNKEYQFYLCEVAACDTENFCEPVDN